jgi:cytochrome c peroxidase
MNQPRIRSWALLCAVSAAIVGCADAAKPTATAPALHDAQAVQAANPHMGHAYSLLAFTATGSTGNPFTGNKLFFNPVAGFYPTQLQGNGRSCATCHVAGDGFTLAAKTAKALPDTAPLISEVLADLDPDIAPLSPEGQKMKLVMLDQLRNVGLIRVVLNNPNYDPQLGHQPDNPKFLRQWRSVPTAFNSALGQFESFDTASGGTFKAFTMWDGREISLERQAGSATIGHAQTVLTNNPTGDVRAFLDAKKVTNDIAAFEKKQLSQPPSLAGIGWQKPVRNKKFDGTIFEGAPEFSMASVKQKFFRTVNVTNDQQLRGMFVFTGTPQKPACIVCHNMPETLAGGTNLFRSDNITEENTQPRLASPDPYTKQIMEEMGFYFFTEAETGELRQQLPNQTMRLKKNDGSWATVTAPDFGLAGQTGKYEDLHEYKVSQLRGIKNFNRFFHDNHERDLEQMIIHYENDFPELFKFTNQQREDLKAFLRAM